MPTIEVEREDDGRWIAEIVSAPGVLVYGQTREEALMRARGLLLFVTADQLKHCEIPNGPQLDD